MPHTSVTISVIVPVYNTELYLAKCLDSIAAQTLRDMEVIMVDDGSTDASREICMNYASTDSRFRLLTIPHSGQSAARNAGLDACRGTHIMFADSDDVIAPDMVSTLYSSLLRANADVAFAGYKRFSGPLPKPDRLHAAPHMNITTGRCALLAMLYQSWPFASSVCGKMFTRESISNLRFHNGRLYEDLEFMFHYLLKTGTVVTISSPLYFYRRNPASTLGTFNLNRLDVLDVTEDIEHSCAHDMELLYAARDRRLSASFNMFALLCRHDLARSPHTDRCWTAIRSLRMDSFRNRHVRLKNKLGILASLAGRRALTAISRHTGL